MSTSALQKIHPNASPKIDLTIIVPVYNEKDSVLQLLDRLKAVFDEGSIHAQILVVDDGSVDGTAELLRRSAYAQDALFSFFFHEKNSGKGAAIHTALTHACGTFTIIQDADLGYDPKDIVTLYNRAIALDLSVVYGSRNLGTSERGSFMFYWGGRLLTWITNILFRQQITDEATCYKLIKTSLLHSFELTEKRFGFCPEVTARIAQNGIRISELPISYTPRSKRHGKKINWRDGVIAIFILIKFKFFSQRGYIPGIVIMLFGIAVYSLTWQRHFGGYEAETAHAALKLFEGQYEMQRAGISSVILYVPFIILYKIFKSNDFSLLSFVPVFYTALTAALLPSILSYLGESKRVRLLVPAAIMLGSLMWPYANIGMEYQVLLYLTGLLLSMLRWKSGKGTLFLPAVLFSLLCVAKSYGPMFGLPVVLFIILSRAETWVHHARNIARVVIPAVVVFSIHSCVLRYTRGSVSGVYSLAHEFQVWTWWEGFYGIFFSIGKSIFLFNPLLILAAYYTPRFLREHRETATYIFVSGALLLLMTAPFSYWSDETLSVRKLVPIIPLLHLPLLYLFQKSFSWRSVRTWLLVLSMVCAVYVQILGASYFYGTQLRVLRAANLDSLYHLRYTPELSALSLHQTLLRNFIFHHDNKLLYHEQTWFRWTAGTPEMILQHAEIDLRAVTTPDITWFRGSSARLVVFYILLAGSACGGYIIVRLARDTRD